MCFFKEVRLFVLFFFNERFRETKRKKFGHQQLYEIFLFRVFMMYKDKTYPTYVPFVMCLSKIMYL